MRKRQHIKMSSYNYSWNFFPVNSFLCKCCMFFLCFWHLFLEYHEIFLYKYEKLITCCSFPCHNCSSLTTLSVGLFLARQWLLAAAWGGVRCPSARALGGPTGKPEEGASSGRVPPLPALGWVAMCPRGACQEDGFRLRATGRRRSCQQPCEGVTGSDGHQARPAVTWREGNTELTQWALASEMGPKAGGKQVSLWSAERARRKNRGTTGRSALPHLWEGNRPVILCVPAAGGRVSKQYKELTTAKDKASRLVLSFTIKSRRRREQRGFKVCCSFYCIQVAF